MEQDDWSEEHEDPGFKEDVDNLFLETEAEQRALNLSKELPGSLLDHDMDDDEKSQDLQEKTQAQAKAVVRMPTAELGDFYAQIKLEARQKRYTQLRAQVYEHFKQLALCRADGQNICAEHEQQLERKEECKVCDSTKEFDRLAGLYQNDLVAYFRETCLSLSTTDLEIFQRGYEDELSVKMLQDESDALIQSCKRDAEEAAALQQKEAEEARSKWEKERALFGYGRDEDRDRNPHVEPRQMMPKYITKDMVQALQRHCPYLVTIMARVSFLEKLAEDLGFPNKDYHAAWKLQVGQWTADQWLVYRNSTLATKEHVEQHAEPVQLINAPTELS